MTDNENICRFYVKSFVQISFKINRIGYMRTKNALWYEAMATKILQKYERLR